MRFFIHALLGVELNQEYGGIYVENIGGCWRRAEEWRICSGKTWRFRSIYVNTVKIIYSTTKSDLSDDGGRSDCTYLYGHIELPAKYSIETIYKVREVWWEEVMPWFSLSWTYLVRVMFLNLDENYFRGILFFRHPLYFVMLNISTLTYMWRFCLV